MDFLSSLQKECPGFYALLSKLFSLADASEIAGDYGQCAAVGANVEEGFEREEGVSFRPRIARIATILVKEAGIRDVPTVRAAIFACAAVRGLPVECPERRVREMAAEALGARGEKLLSPHAYAIAAAVEIDTIRHLHMTSWSPSKKEQRLLEAQELVIRPVQGEAADAVVLRTKLSHAIHLQARSLRGSSPEGV